MSSHNPSGSQRFALLESDWADAKLGGILPVSPTQREQICEGIKPADDEGHHIVKEKVVTKGGCFHCSNTLITDTGTCKLG